MVTGYASAVLGAFLFGSVSSIAKPVLESVNPFLLSSLVYIISGLVFTPIIYSRYKATSLPSQTYPTPFSRKNSSLVILTSLVGATVAPAMFFIGLEHTTAAEFSFSKRRNIFLYHICNSVFQRKIKTIGLCRFIDGTSRTNCNHHKPSIPRLIA